MHLHLICFLEQNKNFSGRCLNRIKMISNEIVTSEELEQQTEQVEGDVEQ